MDVIDLTHEWSADLWDWPLQHKDGVVRVHNGHDRWEVGLDAAFFRPDEIEISLAGDHLFVYCHHEERSDEHGSISREIKRSYKLPDDVDTATIRSHLTLQGILRVTAQKKK
ncbi:hypothetical protein niasHT_029479 [Heterodera trifolii]